VRQLVREAIDQEKAWHDVHGRIRDADDQGDYPEAVQLALSTDAAGAAPRFDAVDRQLDNAIDRTTLAFEEEVSQASSALTGTVIGVIVLALVMASGAVTGIWQRLKEYR
jgi:hypothetical protein